MVLLAATVCQARALNLFQFPSAQGLQTPVRGANNLSMTQLDHPYEAQVNGFDFYIPDDVLLSARLCDLGVRIENTNCPELSKKLLGELKQVGITQLVPKFYLADEWFCPAGSIAIAVPFWLAHPRLTELERTQMGRAEGDTALEFMKLLRHEMGHCVEHAYGLSKRSDWQQVFGSPSLAYSPEKYQWDRKTLNFVRHLPEGYAQSHPEEDFAETFAVWLDPKSAWRKRYQYWDGAIAKLNYVHHLMQECAITKPKRIRYNLIASAVRSKKSVRQIYTARMRDLSC